ncbi:phospholipase D-like domain-containing protein [Schleiferiaceae bacterium]|nr:phospholipase D-like domain-containing protein [Schleiferiaceae bacterium]
MQTEAVFENIAERIVLEIEKAQNSIFIAVAWFTNRNIFNVLQRKAKKGCQINLMYSADHINENSSINFHLLKRKNSNIFPIGDGDQDLMHNKFCVIDHSTVITGSYNWSNKAESNHENITITNGVTTLAEQFISEFNKIKQRYYPESETQKTEFPLSKIIKRLEIIKNFVILEEIDEISRSASKLEKYIFNSDIDEIIDLIQKEDFGDAIHKIESFINRNQQLSIWTDPGIAALKLEIKNLENQINAFDNEKIELEKILADFQHQHFIELGEIILKILKLRLIKFKDVKEKFEEAKRDEEEYQGQFEAEKEKDIQDLNEKQKKELKKKFRKATTLCHPDKFSNEPKEFQKQAEAIFKELNEANANNDLARVTEILENLEMGTLKAEERDRISDKEILKATINRLKRKLQQLESEILNIKQSDTFKTVSSIEDWDIYFEQTKEKLKSELEELKKELA